MGSAAHAICAAIRVTAPAEMFNCGLMSGIGQLALVTVRPEAYCELLSQHPDATSKALQEAQLAYFGMSQRDMMVFMLQDWGIPKLFIDALYYHEDPLSSGYAENSRPLRITYTLQLASLLARACVESEVDDKLLARIKAFGTLLEIETERLDDIAEQTQREWQDWCSVLDIRVRRTPPLHIRAAEVAAPTPEEAAPEAVIEDIAPPPVDPLAESTPPITPLRVLVASANELQCNILGKTLIPHGHTVNIVNTGQKALDLIEKFRPHVLITDWLLPELDGVSLCKAVRKNPLGERIYCIVVTQFEDERRRVDAYEAGADELMRTPLNPRMLSAQMLVAQRYAKIPGEP
jgi:CheY-like chemotaxis protein